MGANAVNTMAELIAPRVEQLTGGTGPPEDPLKPCSPPLGPY